MISLGKEHMKNITCLVVLISWFLQCQPHSLNQRQMLLLLGSSIPPTGQNPGRSGLGEEIFGLKYVVTTGTEDHSNYTKKHE